MRILIFFTKVYAVNIFRQTFWKKIWIWSLRLMTEFLHSPKKVIIQRCVVASPTDMMKASTGRLPWRHRKTDATFSSFCFPCSSRAGVVRSWLSSCAVQLTCGNTAISSQSMLKYDPQTSTALNNNCLTINIPDLTFFCNHNQGAFLLCSMQLYCCRLFAICNNQQLWSC